MTGLPGVPAGRARRHQPRPSRTPDRAAAPGGPQPRAAQRRHPPASRAYPRGPPTPRPHPHRTPAPAPDAAPARRRPVRQPPAPARTRARTSRSASPTRRQLRQSTDQQIQFLALQFQATRCNDEDVLAGNDDPNLPLVTCSTRPQAGRICWTSRSSAASRSRTPRSGMNQRGVGYVVDLQFKSAAANTWADFTAANVGTQTAFTLDSQVVSAPMIHEAIPGGRTQITGDPPFTAGLGARAGQRPEVRLAAAVVRVVGGPNRLGDTGFDVAAGGPDRGRDRFGAGAAVLAAVLPRAGPADGVVASRFRRNGFRDPGAARAATSTTRWTWRVSRV